MLPKEKAKCIYKRSLSYNFQHLVAIMRHIKLLTITAWMRTIYLAVSLFPFFSFSSPISLISSNFVWNKYVNKNDWPMERVIWGDLYSFQAYIPLKALQQGEVCSVPKPSPQKKLQMVFSAFFVTKKYKDYPAGAGHNYFPSGMFYVGQARIFSRQRYSLLNMSIFKH